MKVHLFTYELSLVFPPSPSRNKIFKNVLSSRHTFEFDKALHLLLSSLLFLLLATLCWPIDSPAHRLSKSLQLIFEEWSFDKLTKLDHFLKGTQEWRHAIDQS